MSYKAIGFIGLGKLGLPCAAAMQVRTGLPLFGYDANREIKHYVEQASVPYMESRAEEFLKESNLSILDSIHDVVMNSDVVFLAVQTPHAPEFEGTVPVPPETRDFDYSYLIAAVAEVASALMANPNKSVDLVIISTVLPGTTRKHVLPQLVGLEDRVRVFYNPYFIAMGTTIPDFLNPEFTLLGVEGDVSLGDSLRQLYSQIHSAPVTTMRIESAELTKVAYNTFIGFKIVFANYIGEIAQKTGAHADEVTVALSGATSRLISGKYLSAGMADGGGCHPRDQIAMSHLAQSLELSADPSGWLATARDAQTQLQARQIADLARSTGLPVCILGEAYKRDVNLTVGSPSRLLSWFLEEKGIAHKIFDPFTRPESPLESVPQLFFVATNHTAFKFLSLPKGSVAIDPWGEVLQDELNDGVQILRFGRI